MAGIDSRLLILLPAGAAPPAPAFSGTPTSGQAPLSVAFTDLSTGSPTSWSWDFGEASTSTSQNPVHVYATAGTYDVKLTATNANGSRSTKKVGYITVTAAPAVVVAGHGSEGEDGDYTEPRRVYIDGKPYTVRSRQEYLALLARAKRGKDKAREQADVVIARSQDAARDAVEERTRETAVLLHAVLEREAKKRGVAKSELPMAVLMLIASDL